VTHVLIGEPAPTPIKSEQAFSGTCARLPARAVIGTGAARSVVDDNKPREDEPESERERMTVNIVIAVFFILLVGAGVWLANAMVSVRKGEECVLSGRKNCADIQVPARERY
jgi:hypothetical protein